MTLTRRTLLAGGAGAIAARASRLHTPTWLDADVTTHGVAQVGTFQPAGETLLDAQFPGPALDESLWQPTWRGGYQGRTSAGTVSWFNPSQVVMSDNWQGTAAQLVARPATPTDHTPDPSYTWVSGIITTLGAFGPGVRVSVTARFPRGPGCWPTIAMFADGWPPETDLAEVINVHSSDVHTTLHWLQTSDKTDQQLGHGTNWVDVTQPHTYSIDWFTDMLVWYIDGKPVWCDANPTAIPQCPMYLTVANVVGGVSSWAGPTGPTTPNPAVLRIDSVHIQAWEAAA